MAAFGANPDIEPTVVYTGQHYDKKMSDLLFQWLEIHEPYLKLRIGSGSYPLQSAETMKELGLTGISQNAA